MSIRKTALLCLTAAVICIGAVLLAGKRSPETRSAENSPVFSGTSEADRTPVDSCRTVYHIGLWQGKIAAFREGCSSPETVTDTFAASLPVREQQRLAEGFDLIGDEALERLWEAYTS